MLPGHGSLPVLLPILGLPQSQLVTHGMLDRFVDRLSDAQNAFTPGRRCVIEDDLALCYLTLDEPAHQAEDY